MSFTLDIWERICYHLHYRDICNLSLTCKSLNSVTNRATIYRRRTRGLLKHDFCFSKFEKIFRKTLTYKEAYKDLYFRGRYATPYHRAIPLYFDFVAGVKCTDMCTFKTAYILFTHHKIGSRSIPRFGCNYITNYKGGATTGFKGKWFGQMYLARNLRDSRISPAISIGILDQLDFTRHIHKVLCTLKKMSSFLKQYEYASLFVENNVIKIIDPVCKNKLTFQYPGSCKIFYKIKCEVIPYLKILLDCTGDGSKEIKPYEIIEIIHCRANLIEIDGIPIRDFLSF